MLAVTFYSLLYMNEIKDWPLVSIVLATYNGEKYLEEQLESVVKQTYPNIEIIIVDDKSRDRTEEILRRYAFLYSNIQVYINDVNLGYIKNFQKGCQLASGDFISFCDQDDVWDVKKTTLLMSSIGNYPMIYCDDELVDEKLNILKKHSDIKNLASFDNCLYFATDNCVGGHSLIMRKELLPFVLPFPVQMPHDLWCAFIATFHGGIKYYNQPLVKWRQHSKNITTSKKDKKIKMAETRKRLELFYNACPSHLTQEKQILKKLVQSYKSYSLYNNYLRMLLFFKYKKYLLGMKKRSSFRKFLFCLKMFFKMRLHVA